MSRLQRSQTPGPGLIMQGTIMTSVPSFTMSDIPANENDAINIIAQDMKSLVQKIQDLRHIGIEDHRIALPKICVIGDQSTGKSSLIEGMSEIKVPRSAGTCTRCPMEINLSESEPGQPWTCRVFLSRRYMFDGTRKMTKLPRKAQPLGPWLQQDQEDEPFITLSDKEKVQDAIQWAQIAILNPSVASSDYIPGRNEGATMEYQVKFSPSVVRLDISAPDFPNLSFYDLPGVISQAEFDEERYLVSLVENLVKGYISQEHCIILLALPMTDDATNSSAARIMRDVRNAKSRTLGVLTKPDRVEKSEYYDQWIEILEGDKFSLGHGYYVVRNNPDPSIEHAQAREEENAFFATSPWATDLVAYQNRFGTRNLQTALSNLLLGQIQGCLPRIIQQINEKAHRIDEELRTLPDTPNGNVQWILCKHILNLGERISAHIEGGSSDYPLQKQWGHVAQDFKRALIKTRPTVNIAAASDTTKLAVDRDVDSDCEMTGVQRPVQGPVKRKLDDNPAPVKDAKEEPAQEQKQSGYFTNHFDEFTKPAHRFTWEEIRGINEDSYRAGIPDQADPKAIEIMRQQSVKHWKEPMLVFLRATHSLVKDMMLRQLGEVFAQYYQTSLFRELKRIIESYLRELEDEHIEHALENYDIEYNKPFTMATNTLTQAIKASYQFLSNRRHLVRASCYLKLRGVPIDDPRMDTRKLNAMDVGPDDFTQELKMMASARGYYDVASSRFLDFTCQSVHTKLFSKCQKELFAVIERELGVNVGNTTERCQELMAEDPERQRRRNYLLKEREKIAQAQEWLATVKKEDDGSGFGVRIKNQEDEWMRSSYQDLSLR